MKGAFRLGRILGINVFVHFSFFFIFIWRAYYAYADEGNNIYGVLFECAVVGGVFLCVLMHEFGHALAARRYGIQTNQIVLLPIGGVAQLKRMPEKPAQELWVAFAGPLVNVALILLLFPIVLLQFPLNYFYSFKYIDKMIDNFTFRLLLSNVILLLFNLLPAFPMDGGRVLRALLGFWLNFKNATRIAVRLGQLMSIGFVIAGYFYSPFLIIIGLFVFFGAEMEWRVVKRKAKQFHFSVGDALAADYIKIPAHENVKDALAITFGNNTENDFLVEENGNFAGVISREKLFEKIAEGDDNAQVVNIMQTDFPQITVDDSAEEALQYMQLFKTTILPVYNKGKWIGAISQNNIINIFIRHQALNN